MTKSDPAAGSAITAAAVTPGLISRIVASFSSIMKADPKLAQEMLADAALGAQSEIAKAHDLMKDTADTPTHIIEDQWSGPPDDRLKVHRITGGDAAPQGGGSANIGPAQAASGDGAEKMSREYSHPAPQGGVQLATERLGRELMRQRSAMKSMLGAFSQYGTLVEMLKSTVAEQAFQIGMLTTTLGEVQTGIVKAAAKADADAATKAFGKEDDDKDDGKEPDVSIIDDKEGDDEDADESAKCQSFLVKAKAALVKATEAEMDGNVDAVKKHLFAARKAFTQALPQKTIGRPLAKSLRAFHAALAKAMPTAQSQNQKVWPASEAKPAGSASTAKAAPEAVTAAASPPDAATMAKAVETVNNAARGLAMLQTDVRGLMSVMAGGSTAGVPPVFEIVKANPSVLNESEGKIHKLVADSVITQDEGDRSIDMIGRIRAAAEGRIDAGVVEAQCALLPAIVRSDVFKLAA